MVNLIKQAGAFGLGILFTIGVIIVVMSVMVTAHNVSKANIAEANLAAALDRIAAEQFKADIAVARCEVKNLVPRGKEVK